MSVIAGTGSYNTDASIALTQAAEKAGADAALVVVPYYNKPTQEGMIQHFKAIASSTNLPIILYNVPGRTVSNILPATVAKLADECPNIVGIKEATGNLAQVGELAAIVPATFAIYSGDDFVTLPMLSVGGCGVISVSSHVIGPMISQMHEAFFSKDLDTARALHLKSLSITKALFCTTSPSPVKYAMAKLGIISNSSLRLPMVEPEENEKKLIETALSWIL
jgi:4-hydroxy-tetrahydrodipicolinate synthase